MKSAENRKISNLLVLAAAILCLLFVSSYSATATDIDDLLRQLDEAGTGKTNEPAPGTGTETIEEPPLPETQPVETATGTVDVDENLNPDFPDDSYVAPEPEPEPEPPTWIRSLELAVPGEVEYLKGGYPQEPIIGLEVFELDDYGARGLVLLTTGAMQVYSFDYNQMMKLEWSGDFVKEFPRRGLAASVYAGLMGNTQLIYVSMNEFQKSFAYKWENRTLEKAGRVNGFFVDVLGNHSVNLMSEYGSGVISFNGPATYFVDTSGDAPVRTAFPFLEDFYSGCIMRWMQVSVDLARVAIVTEQGAIKVFQGRGSQVARTEPEFGGALACGPETAEGGFLFATTQSGTDDAVIMMELTGNTLEEKWRSPGLGGAITEIIPVDLDGDGITEILGVLDVGGGKQVLFRVLPPY